MEYIFFLKIIKLCIIKLSLTITMSGSKNTRRNNKRPLLNKSSKTKSSFLLSTIPANKIKKSVFFSLIVSTIRNTNSYIKEMMERDEWKIQFLKHGDKNETILPIILFDNQLNQVIEIMAATELISYELALKILNQASQFFYENSVSNSNSNSIISESKYQALEKELKDELPMVHKIDNSAVLYYSIIEPLFFETDQKINEPNKTNKM